MNICVDNLIKPKLSITVTVPLFSSSSGCIDEDSTRVFFFFSLFLFFLFFLLLVELNPQALLVGAITSVLLFLVFLFFFLVVFLVLFLFLLLLLILSSRVFWSSSSCDMLITGVLVTGADVPQPYVHQIEQEKVDLRIWVDKEEGCVYMGNMGLNLVP